MPFRAAFRSSWQHGAGAASLFLGFFALIGLGSRFSLSSQVLLWSGYLLIAGLVVGRAVLHLLGPVFRYELVRTARRGSYALHRSVYLLLLGVLPLGVYAWWLRPASVEQLLFQPNSLSIADVTRFAGVFFFSFMSLQLAIVLLVTPLFTADAMTREKEGRTLEVLLTTELRDREIVLGILGGRLAGLLLIALSGLPIFSVMQLLGGVVPEQVLAGFAVALLTIISLGSVGVYTSIHARTSLEAYLVTYCWAMLFFAPLNVAEIIGLDEVFPLVGEFPSLALSLVIHLTIAALACTASVGLLRRAALAMPSDTVGVRLALESATAEDAAPAPLPAMPVQPSNPAASMLALDHDLATAYDLPAKSRPPVRDWPLFWKEVSVEPYLHPGHATGFLTCMTGCILSSALIVGVVVISSFAAEGSTPAAAQRWVRIVGVSAAMLLLLLIALNAAGRISRERQRGSWDALRGIPVATEAILFTKWLGSILAIRWCCWFLIGVGVFGLVTHGLHPFAVPLVLLAATVYAMTAASLGIYCSAGCRSPLRASILAVGGAVLMLCGPLTPFRIASGDWVFFAWDAAPTSWTVALINDALTPPLTLSLLCFRSDDLADGPLRPRIFVALAGLAVYVFVALLSWLGALVAVRSEAGPRPKQRPRFPFAGLRGSLSVSARALSADNSS